MAQDNNSIPAHLLVEYQVCQEAANGNSAGVWSFAGIFLGLSITALGFLIPSMFQPHSIGFSVFMTIVGVLMIIIYIAVHGLHIRMRQRTRLYYKRMCEIEGLTGMVAQSNQYPLTSGISGFIWWTVVIITLGLLWFVAVVFVWSCQI
jgi:hypothetical protein